MATHSSVLVWRIPGDGGAWWAAVYGVVQSDMTEANSFQIFWGLFNLHNCVCEPIPCDKIEFGQKFDQM